MSRRLPHCKLRTISFLFTSRPLSPWWTKWPAGATAVSLPFTLTVDVVLALISIFLLLPHSRLIIPLMDHKNHCALHHLCGSMCVCVCANQQQLLCGDTSKAPGGIFFKLVVPSGWVSYFLFPHSFPRSPDSCSFNVTSQESLPGWDSCLEWTQRESRMVSVFGWGRAQPECG